MAWCDVVEPRTLRECRIALGKSQAAFAALLGVSAESYRTWDAGRRATPPLVMVRARVIATHRDDHALLPLPERLAALVKHPLSDRTRALGRFIPARAGVPRAGGDEPNLPELLREAMNTVGKTGQLGAQIRCVVSVSMLTEGWDANNVTHILGIRAFGTQLLCEQERWTPIFGQVVKVESRSDRRNLECHARDGATRLS